MPHPGRAALIRELEAIRNSRVICYVTGDRQPVPSKIGDDAVRPLIALLRQIGQVPTIDLFLYTKGGSTDVPWRIVRQLRNHVTTGWNVLVPLRAQSAGTLIALGADEIILTDEGELGPIDPSIQIAKRDDEGTKVGGAINVEDVMAYVRFLRERGGLTDQTVLASALERLVERVDPVTLGTVYRTHAHIRDLARRILSSRSDVPKVETQEQIVATLAEHVYAHGHAIGLATAQEIGLPARKATPEEDQAIWRLWEAYENDLGLRSPIDALHALGGNDQHTEDVVIAAVESSDGAFEFGGTLDVRAKRRLPQQLNVSLNLNLQMPAGVQNLPANAQATLQAIVTAAQQAALMQAQKAVQDALSAQAPLIGADIALRGARWTEAGVQP